jgi:hypothetical protein
MTTSIIGAYKSIRALLKNPGRLSWGGVGKSGLAGSTSTPGRGLVWAGRPVKYFYAKNNAKFDIYSCFGEKTKVSILNAPTQLTKQLSLSYGCHLERHCDCDFLSPVK